MAIYECVFISFSICITYSALSSSKPSQYVQQHVFLCAACLGNLGAQIKSTRRETGCCNIRVWFGTGTCLKTLNMLQIGHEVEEHIHRQLFIGKYPQKERQKDHFQLENSLWVWIYQELALNTTNLLSGGFSGFRAGIRVQLKSSTRVNLVSCRVRSGWQFHTRAEHWQGPKLT